MIIFKKHLTFSVRRIILLVCGVDVTPHFSRKYYLLSGVGKNGYIVSAYPIGEKEALELIGRYGK